MGITNENISVSKGENKLSDLDLSFLKMKNKRKTAIHRFVKIKKRRLFIDLRFFIAILAILW